MTRAPFPALTLFEREVSKGDHESRLRKAIGASLAKAGSTYDIVLIDSAPGLSVLTECFLREASFYLSPTKPDFISLRGLSRLTLELLGRIGGEALDAEEMPEPGRKRSESKVKAMWGAMKERRVQ